jgi:hypothetical protein
MMLTSEPLFVVSVSLTQDTLYAKLLRLYLQLQRSFRMMPMLEPSSAAGLVCANRLNIGAQSLTTFH